MVCSKLNHVPASPNKNKHITLSARLGKGEEINTKYTEKCILYIEIQKETIHGSNSDNSFSERKVHCYLK